MSGDGNPERRRFLRLVGAGSVAGVSGLAGCTGDSGGQEQTTTSSQDGNQQQTTETEAQQTTQDNDYWPPPNNQVTAIQPAGLGGINDQFLRAYKSVLDKYWPGDEDVETVIVNRPGADGIVGAQELYKSEGDGSTFGSPFYSQAVRMVQDANLAVSDFNWFANGYSSIRCFGLNPKTMPVDGHFDLSSISELKQIIEDRGPLRFYVSQSVPSHQYILAWFLRGIPGVTEDDWVFVPVAGVEEGRAAFLRGDLDGYATLLNLQYVQRDDFIKVQFVFGDPEFTPGLFNTFTQTESGDGEFDGIPREQWLTELSDYPQERAESIAQVFLSGMAFALPPDTPQEVLDIYHDVFEKASKDEERKERIREQGNATVDAPQVGASMNKKIGNLVQTRLNSETYKALQEEFSV
jgi:tripartite-type tricarboxylate transporter receptor subunit TctC